MISIKQCMFVVSVPGQLAAEHVAVRSDTSAAVLSGTEAGKVFSQPYPNVIWFEI